MIDVEAQLIFPFSSRVKVARSAGWGFGLDRRLSDGVPSSACRHLLPTGEGFLRWISFHSGEL